MDTRARRAWVAVCVEAGFVIGAAAVAFVRYDAPEELLNLAMLNLGALAGAVVAKVAVERRLPSWPRLRRSRTGQDMSLTGLRGAAYQFVFFVMYVVLMLTTTLTFHIDSWPYPLGLFALYISIAASFAIGQGVVEAWALTHPSGRVARL